MSELTKTLADGTRVIIRPIRPDDKKKLAAGLEALSPHSRYLRFMRPVAELSDRELAYLTELDYTHHFAWAAQAADLPGRPGLGVARYVRDPLDPEVAEAAVAVIDDFQGLGLGTILMTLLAETALDNGIRRFRAFVLPENQNVLSSLRKRGAELRSENGLIRVDFPLDGDSPLQVLRASADGSLPAEPGR
jgi:GNAT superfamily N-acetyltransferase